MKHDASAADQLTNQWRLIHGRLEPGETVTLPILTGSMAPLIPAHAVIEVEAVPEAADLQVGDIAVFRQGERLVAHRLVFGCPLPAPGWFLQRGDGVSEAGIVGGHSIVGRVIAVHRTPHERIDLTSPGARRHAMRTARRTLYRLILSWLGRRLRPRPR